MLLRCQMIAHTYTRININKMVLPCTVIFPEIIRIFVTPDMDPKFVVQFIRGYNKLEISFCPNSKAMIKFFHD